MTQRTPYPDDDVNILTAFWALPCEASLLVYAEAIGDALKNALVTLLIPQIDDVVRGFIRPQKRHRKRKGRKGNKGGITWLQIPEVGEEIGQKVRSYTTEAAPIYNDGGKALWKIDAVFQKAGFVVLIHGVVSDFWMDYVSGIIGSSDANCSGIARIECSEPLAFHTPPVGWVGMGMGGVVYNTGMTHHVFFVEVPAGQFQAILKVHGANNSALPLVATVNCRIQTGYGEHDINDYAGEQHVAKDAQFDMLASIRFHGPAIVTYDYYSANSETVTFDCTLNIFQVGEAGIY